MSRRALALAGTIQGSRYCNSSFRLVAGQFWLGKFGSASAYKNVKYGYSFSVLKGALFTLQLALRAVEVFDLPRAGCSRRRSHGGTWSRRARGGLDQFGWAKFAVSVYFKLSLGIFSVCKNTLGITHCT